MSAQLARRLAWSTFLVSVLVGSVAVAMELAAGTSSLQTSFQPVILLLFSLVGAVIAGRDQRNPVGWIFVALGFAFTVLLATAGYASFAAVMHSPGGAFAGWLGWVWVPVSALAIIFVPLLFPTGRLLSPRWRIFAWCGLAFAAIAGPANALSPTNPFGLHVDERLRTDLINLSLVPGVVALAGAVASLTIRFRRARPLERQQLKWFLVASIPFILGFALHGAISPEVQNVLLTVGLIALPLSVGVAILRYRLYDIDVVINKSLVYGALAAFITAVYVGIVVGIGALLGSGGKPNLALSIVATAIVAVAFQPVRERVQRIANRLVYGKRASPYEVMADFAERMAGALSVDDVLPKMAEAAARGVGAQAARIRLFFPDGPERVISWPDRLEVEHFDRVLPISDRGDPMGEIAVVKAMGEPITPAEGKLLTDLTAQAGLVMHNVRLTVELQRRLAEISLQAAQLRTSRQRIVAAQDEERRRLEETIRRGSEEQLIRIREALKSAELGLASDPGSAVVALEGLTAQATAVLEELRELARGVYPPVLEHEGLAAALQAHLGRMSPPVAIDSDAIDRYPSEIEAAIYFCCVEALQSVTGPAAVRLGGRDACADFSISGCGPLDSRLQRMEDRVEALGGSLQFDGSTLGGSIPIGLHPPPPGSGPDIFPAPPGRGRVGASFSR